MKNKDNVNNQSTTESKVECRRNTVSSGDGYKYYLQGNVMKYLWRYEHKNNKNQIEDLEKAQWYLKELIKKIK